MRNIYGRSAWHFPNIDIHHALLARSLGGGRAYLSTLCDSSTGFGMSTGLLGNYQHMGAASLWDFYVVGIYLSSYDESNSILTSLPFPTHLKFMHELGHNFGTMHTHDDPNYSPLIDTCGIPGSCPAGLPKAGSATIMSYCHGCS
jgi:hypothetical protein